MQVRAFQRGVAGGVVVAALVGGVMPGGVASASGQASCTAPVWSEPAVPFVGQGAINAGVVFDVDGPGPVKELVALGGRFALPGLGVGPRVALWDGATLTNLGAAGVTGSASGEVRALAVWNGSLVAGGGFGVQIWTGSAWTAVGSLSGVSALAVYNGDLIAGGGFQVGGASAVARWTGSAWEAMDLGLTLPSGAAGTVEALLPFGTSLIAGGQFTRSGGTFLRNIASWEGDGWQPVGPFFASSAPVFALAEQDGNLIAAGAFSIFVNATQFSGAARWNGVEWLPVTGGDNPLGSILGIAEYQGELVAAGPFSLGFSPGNVAVRTDAGWVRWGDVPAGLSGSATPRVVLNTGDGVLVAGVSASGSPVVAAARCPRCDSVDFNNDGVFPDDNDLADFIFVLGGGTCATCNDVDFDNDGVFPDDADLATLLFVLGGGTC